MYKRQFLEGRAHLRSIHHFLSTRPYHQRLWSVRRITSHRAWAVSYTHLDVYKRQVLPGKVVFPADAPVELAEGIMLAAPSYERPITLDLSAMPERCV